MPVYSIGSVLKRRFSRAMAFEARGVTLKYASHSWSGLCGNDGAVVIAIRAADVRVDDHGSSCLLWAPALETVERLDRASHDERLEHCRIAVRHGTAEGLLAYGEGAAFDPNEVIALVVAKAGDQYWARWGSVARAEDSGPFVLWGLRSNEARLAA